jgi:phosphoserine phosphatase RsbU/P
LTFGARDVAVSCPHPLPTLVQEVLDPFGRAVGGGVRLWHAQGGGWCLAWPTDATVRAGPGDNAVSLAEGAYCAEADSPEAQPQLQLLVTVLDRLLGLERDLRKMSQEIAERYEEITLLYSISETLGSVISLEEAAAQILSEVISTLGARRAALWVHDPVRDTLELAAAVGHEGQSGPIRIDDASSVTATVFRTHQPLIMDPADVFPRDDDDRVHSRGYFLSVPVSYTPPQGQTRTVGVINLVDRTSDEPFDAGDLQLVSAIASQVGAAVENSRLVRETLRRERLVREMELAHDLQLKLLPSAERFVGYAEVAARCLPAESVGGDFYHLFRLSGGRLGVMIGDVSSHGFSAALIMALTMSAVAIHAAEGDPPAEVLRRVHHALIHELETTEMYLTLFYGVIDPAARQITFANAGHHHAFRLDDAGQVERLGATNPPFGIVDLDTYAEASTDWSPGRDILFLFTDGLPDALAAGQAGGEKTMLDLVLADPAQPLQARLDALFEASVSGSSPEAVFDDRTALLVRK